MSTNTSFTNCTGDPHEALKDVKSSWFALNIPDPTDQPMNECCAPNPVRPVSGAGCYIWCEIPQYYLNETGGNPNGLPDALNGCLSSHHENPRRGFTYDVKTSTATSRVSVGALLKVGFAAGLVATALW